MEPSRLSIECLPFHQLRDVIRVACGGAAAGWTSTQVEYIVAYLHGGVTPRTLVVERPYVDRHYLEEYGAYYFSSLRNGGATTTRIHVFAEAFDRTTLGAWIHDAAAGDLVRQHGVCERLRNAYLGFITVRPIPSAPIGRTILRPYEDKPARSFIPADRSDSVHKVHLMGLVLEAHGLPFQQQEQAVGACATTALWSAMSRVVRADGGRAPTPHAITQAATRHFAEDRALPAVSGLALAQLTAAVRELGHSPYVLRPTGEYATFVLSLKCYLRSGIPAVLVLSKGGGEYHAVTASGYRLGDDEEPAMPIEVSAQLRSTGISRLYVHDDQFGPYLRMRIDPPSDAGEDTILRRLGPSTNDPAHTAGGAICYAIFPLYPKLRLTARELIGTGLDMLPVVRSILDAGERERLNVEVFFMHGGRYQGQLLSLGLGEPARVEQFVSTVALPRYVGVIRFQLDDAALVDIVCDTTDISRDHPRRSPILAVVPIVAKHVTQLRTAMDTMAPWTIVV